MTEEKFEFTSGIKNKIFITLGIGLLLFIIGVLTVPSGHGHGAADEEGHASAIVEHQGLLASTDDKAEQHADDNEEVHGKGEHHGSSVTVKRIFANLWINNVYFAGLGMIGLFFVAIQYATQAGWSAGMKRIPLAMASWIPISGILMIVLYFIVGHDVFHWTHTDLYEVGGPHFDEIINGKKGFFFWPLSETPSFPVFYLLRMVLFFGLWFMFFKWIKREMLAEDINGGTAHWLKARKYSAIFLVIFAFSSSIAAWDWVMSIDTHWFSTMFGWYVFASWWVTGLSMITLIVVLLKQAGYLKIVNANHLHDIGKFVFGFSIFWTYIWFSQFLLIYYANIPEETVYFIQRMTTSQYRWVFFLNLFLNFVLPFLLLMTRDSKRQMSMLKVVCPIIIVGHWFDFYLMVTPGVMQHDGGFGLLEIGMTMIFGAVFIFVTLTNLAKVPLFAKNHPMLQESLHHHI